MPPENGDEGTITKLGVSKVFTLDPKAEKRKSKGSDSFRVEQ